MHEYERLLYTTTASAAIDSVSSPPGDVSHGVSAGTTSGTEGGGRAVQTTVRHILTAAHLKFATVSSDNTRM